MWYFVVGVAIALAATYFLAPKSQSQPPAGFDELQVPTAEEGREIPVLFGTRLIRSSNVVWWGDFSTSSIKASGGGKK